MTLLNWKPEFSVGNAAIDYEHEMMIQQINALYDRLGTSADSAAIEAALGEIHADISAHFALGLSDHTRYAVLAFPSSRTSSTSTCQNIMKTNSWFNSSFTALHKNKHKKLQWKPG